MERTFTGLTFVRAKTITSSPAKRSGLWMIVQLPNLSGQWDKNFLLQSVGGFIQKITEFLLKSGLPDFPDFGSLSNLRPVAAFSLQ